MTHQDQVTMMPAGSPPPYPGHAYSTGPSSAPPPPPPSAPPPGYGGAPMGYPGYPGYPSHPPPPPGMVYVPSQPGPPGQPLAQPAGYPVYGQPGAYYPQHVVVAPNQREERDQNFCSALMTGICAACACCCLMNAMDDF